MASPVVEGASASRHQSLHLPTLTDIYLLGCWACSFRPPFYTTPRLRILFPPVDRILALDMSKEPIYVDFSLPLSELLHKGTAVAHDEVSKSKGAAWLVRGELDREEYVRFLMMLYHVYEYVPMRVWRLRALMQLHQHA